MAILRRGAMSDGTAHVRSGNGRNGSRQDLGASSGFSKRMREKNLQRGKLTRGRACPLRARETHVQGATLRELFYRDHLDRPARE
jgi:hypothetical protein